MSIRFARWLRAVWCNRRGAVPRPAWCTYLVTYRCNARCGMCDSWKQPPQDELTPPQAATLFRQLRPLDVVRITGGEPFLRRDLAELVRAIDSAARPRVLHITTNGSFPQRVQQLIADFPAPRRLRFMVSFDGLAPEHDRNRGPAVTFARALETTRLLARARRTHGVEVSVNHTVISAQSLADHDELRRILATLGVEVHAVLAYADSAMYGLTLHGGPADHLVPPRGYPLHPAVPRAAATDFVARELHRAGRYRSPLLRWGKAYYLRGLLNRLRSAAAPRPRPPCVALRSHIRLLPDGRVPVCQFNTSVVGDLRNDTLTTLWHNARTAAARAWVDRCPGCWAECEVVPNALYSGDILRGG